MSDFQKLDDFTTEQIEAAIAHALSEGDIDVVEHLMLALAWKDARRALVVFETMKIGLAYASRENGDA